MSGFAAQIAAEQARVAAGEPRCGHACPGCHGTAGLACVRLTHPDSEDNRTPHVVNQPGVGLVQWLGPCPIAGDAA